MKKNPPNVWVQPHCAKKMLQGMKLVLFFVVLFLSSASVFAQRVNISVKAGMTLNEVLKQVKDQTGVRILYDAGKMKHVKCREMKMVDLDIVEALKQILKDTRFEFFEEGGVYIVREALVRQEQTIRIVGRVTDEKKQPIPGVTVLWKGTPLGTTTDGEGRYQVSRISRNQQRHTLVFSFVGMITQEVVYTGQDSINVVMKDDVEMLDDVVVTGYMKVNKGSYVGAVNTVKVDDIKIAGMTSIDQMLQGVVPGMTVRMSTGQVGASPKIRVRGTSTLLGNKEPVWVVDGVVQREPIPMQDELSGDIEDLRLIVSNAISWLNPNDIETLTVLKDASATAIYGSQASNGVIVITTKKAEAGKLSVSYNGNLTVGQRPRYGMYDRMTSRERMRLSQEIYEERVSFPSSVLPIGYEGLLEKLNNKEITKTEMEKEFRKLEQMNTDWFGILFRNSVSHQHSLSVTGGSEKISNRTSINISETIGEAIGNEMTNFSASSSTTMRFFSNLQASFLINGSLRNTEGFAYGVDPFTYAYNTSRVIPAYNEAGTLFYHEKEGDSSTAIPFKSRYNYNIINERDNSGNENTTKTLSASLDLNWTLLSGLQYQGVFSYSLSSANIKSWATEQSYYIANIRGYEFGLATRAEEEASRLPFGGLLYTEESSVRNYTFRNSLVYDKTFNKVHHMTLQVGVEVSSAKTTGTRYKNYGYLRFRGESFARVPLTYLPVGLANETDNDLYTEMEADRKVVNRKSNSLSEYFTGIYSYDNRYVVNFNARLDASNRFGQDPDKKFRPTWSVGAKWRVANEPFTREWNWIDGLDISASYGYQGNAVETVSPYLIATDGGYHSLYKQYMLKIKGLPYNNLGWEKTKSWNFSVDLAFLSGRLNVLANVFGKTDRKSVV